MYPINMDFLRKSLLVIIVPILTILFYSIATNFAFVQVVGNSEKLKSTLASSGIYDSVLGGLLTESQAVSNGSQTVSLRSSAITEAAAQTFNPQFIQTNTESVIDSLYKWLDGATQIPDFHIDLTAARADFAKNAGVATTKKLSNLPPCPAGSTIQSFNAETATCLPNGVDPATEGARVEQSINAGEGFLDHPIITAASIKSEGNSQSVFEQSGIKNAPQAFQTVKVTPYIMGVLAVLLSAAVVFLSRTKKAGFRKIGFMLLVAGVFLLGAAYTVSWSVNKEVPKRLQLNNTVLSSSLVKLVKDVGGQVGQNYYIFGGAYAAIGAGFILGATFIGKNKNDSGDDLRGEGRTKEDRIDIKEPVKATDFVDKDINKKSKVAAKPKTPTKSKPVASPPATPKSTARKKIIVQ